MLIIIFAYTVGVVIAYCLIEMIVKLIKKRNKYFLVFYEGVKGFKSIIGYACTSVIYNQIIKDIKSKNPDLEGLVITGIVRISKKEYEIWNA